MTSQAICDNLTHFKREYVPQTELFALTSNRTWKKVYSSEEPSFTRHTNIHRYVLFLLNNCQNKPNTYQPQNVETFHQGTHTDLETSISMKILNVESHRHCTILEAHQIDHITGGSRYLVYGIKRPGFEDYGIGTTLNSVASTHKIPTTLPNNIAYLLDD